jgi:PAS domain S-box-containing protein
MKKKARRSSAPSAKRRGDAENLAVSSQKSGRPVLVFLPNKREKTLVANALTRAGIRAEFFAQLDELATCVSDQTGALLLAEEGLAGAAAAQLMERLRAQPNWSDLPLLVVTGRTKVPRRIRDLAGASANVMCLARPLRDFTLISAVRATLRARRSQYEVRDLIEERDTVLSSISEAFSALDRDWRYTHVNDRVAEMAGWPKEKMIGQVIWEIFPEAVGTEFYEKAQRVMRTREPSHGEFFYASWKRWVDTRMYPTKDGLVIFRADITERKRQEQLLERAKNAAEEANQAKDKFLAMLSHELRTPLTPVLMTIAALRRQPELSEDMRRDLEMLQRNVELEALLIDDLLDLTRITHGKLELHSDALDIHSALDQALSISAGDLGGKNISVTRRFEARERHCWADPARLQQVFWNLIKNAAKFTPQGGRVSVATRNDGAHHIVIEISDDGVGIEPELLPRIFDAFEQGGRTVTSKYGGLGLGLAISKRVVDLHQGSLEARSAGPGQGATFVVTLKAMETSLLEGPVLFLESEPSVARLIQILFVEDHEDTARALSRLLMNAGYAVSHANSVARARELAAGQRFDLVISDLGLPDGSGLDLMGQLSETWSLPGIALSGFGTDDDVAASNAAGFAEHITKPVDWERLRSAIERLTLAKDSAERSAA